MLQPLLNSIPSSNRAAGLAMHRSLQFAMYPAELSSLEPLLQMHVQSAVCRVGHNWAPEQRMTLSDEFLRAFRGMWRDAFRTLRDDSAQWESEAGYMAAHVTFRPLGRKRVQVTLLVTTDRRARSWAGAVAQTAGCDGGQRLT